MGFQTRIDKALQQAKSDMFTRQNGAREGVPKMLILLTDGTQTGRGSIDPSIPAEALRRAGVYLVVIGIGKKIDVDELKRMAGDSGKYHTAASFDELISGDFIKSVSSGTCPGKQKYPGVLLNCHFLFTVLLLHFCVISSHYFFSSSLCFPDQSDTFYIPS